MSRHRDVRNMDYSEDYDGYDDVYGHSVEDDFYISPSHRQFMYNRDSSGQSKSDCPMEEDIQEVDEIDEEFELSDEDRTKLESCLEHVKCTLAPIRLSRKEKVKIIIAQKYNIEKIVDSILKAECSPSAGRRDRDETFSLYNSFSKACHNSINRHKTHSPSQVEPQSEVNLRTFNNRNSLQFKNNIDAVQVGSSLDSVDYCSSRSDNLKDSKENSEELSSSFLSRMKNNKNNSSQNEGANSPVASFLSRMKIPSKETDVKENKSPEISFLSRISRHQKELYADDMSKKNSNVKKIDLDNSPKSSENFKIRSTPLRFKLDRDSEADSVKPNNITLNFTSRVPVNGTRPTVNDNFNSLLGTMGSKQTLSTVEKTKSDISFITKNSLPKDFLELKINETKSMPLLGSDKLDGGSSINLITALQKGNYESLKFRPTKSEEQFDIPFVDCECDETLDDEIGTFLECTMDLSHLATKTLPYSKNRPSPLGRILCLKYRISKNKKFKKQKIRLDPRLTVFDFSEPSPDDQIKKHIRRNL